MHKDHEVDSFDYLRRVLAERLGELRLAGAQQDFDAQLRLLRYMEAEGREEVGRLQRCLLAAEESAARLSEEAVTLRAQDDARARSAVDAAQAEARALRAELDATQAEARALRAIIEEAHAAASAALTNAAAGWAAAAAARADAGHARDMLHAVYHSNSWKLTGPIRRLARFFGRRQSQRQPAMAQSSPEPSARGTGTFLGAPPHDVSYEEATGQILRRYFPPGATGTQRPQPLHMLFGSAALVFRRLASVPPRSEATVPNAPVRIYTIITPFFRHESFFVRCAQSVAALVEAGTVPAKAPEVNWIVVNDDPSCPDERLQGLLPPAVRNRTRIISDGRNHGIAAALNIGVRAAADGWILLLDCDDMLEPHAVRTLNAWLDANPGYRYVSSAMIDIDENDRELRRRRQADPPERLFEAGMVAGHLVAFRRDLFDELGGFDTRFSGVQDYDFALRAAAQEPLGQMPEHLYRYRWHPNTVSVSRMGRQERLTDAVRASFLRRLVNPPPGRPLCRQPLREVPRGLCIIRTQGTRMELLREAIASVRSQGIPMTPCIVVHGGVETFDFVRRRVLNDAAAQEGPAPIFLVAPEDHRRRGHPCNVGLTHLRAEAGQYDVLCFLDDDDYLLPHFATRLVQTMRLTGADFAYGLTNALPTTGEPFVQHQLLPTVALFGGNFMPINSYLIVHPPGAVWQAVGTGGAGAGAAGGGGGAGGLHRLYGQPADPGGGGSGAGGGVGGTGGASAPAPQRGARGG